MPCPRAPARDTIEYDMGHDPMNVTVIPHSTEFLRASLDGHAEISMAEILEAAIAERLDRERAISALRMYTPHEDAGARTKSEPTVVTPGWLPLAAILLLFTITAQAGVQVSETTITLPTWSEGPPDTNPLFDWFSNSGTYRGLYASYPYTFRTNFLAIPIRRGVW
jgi:hypothetical protein